MRQVGHRFPTRDCIQSRHEMVSISVGVSGWHLGHRLRVLVGEELLDFSCEASYNGG